jgi:hypothetical protein
MIKKKVAVKKVVVAKKHHKLEKHKVAKHKPMKKAKAKSKVEKVMHEFKEHKLHSGSKKGPEVTNPKQAIAIALSEARKSGAKITKKKMRKKKK